MSRLLTRDARADYEPEVSGMMVDDTVRMTHHPKSRDLAIAGFKVIQPLSSISSKYSAIFLG